MERIDVRDFDLCNIIDGIDFNNPVNGTGARSLSYAAGKLYIDSEEGYVQMRMDDIDNLIKALETAKRVWG